MKRRGYERLGLLNRVAELGAADRFRLVDLSPAWPGEWSTALDQCLNSDLVERVIERCGVWHYRLTAAGRAAQASGRLPKQKRNWGDTREDPPEPTGVGFPSGRRKQSKKTW